MNKDYIYSLRIGICPDFYPDEKFETLLEFCEKAQIDDIQFFVNMEEMNQGHLSVEDTKKWLSMIAKFKPELEKRGFTVSLNPWTSILHEDRGRKLLPDQKFTTMTDMNGNKAQAVACPLDENFRSYIEEIYSLYAELNFNVIWVEDDFRLHNHGSLEWGGCFCELHQKEFSKHAKKDVSISEIIDGFSKQGEPHPYRNVWLDTARDTMTGLADVLGNAVHKIAPETRVGLMSSGPETHCTEGRDWEKILTNLAGDTRPLNRPHLPAYNDVASFRYALNFQRFPRLSAAMTKGAELWPELENFPHTTFSKSHRFTTLELESTLALCAGGITLNIFDMMGNGVNTSQKYDKALSEIKPYLNGVTRLGLNLMEEQGVTILYNSKSSYTIHANGDKTPAAITPRETFWAEYLAAFGVAYRYSEDASITGKMVAVSGQYFRNLTKEEIEHLFENNYMFIDGEAASVLYDMGVGHVAHIASAEWYPVNTGKHAYEQVTDGRIYQNLPEARMSAQTCNKKVEPTDYLNITYDTEECEIVTMVKAPNGTDVGKGITCFENQLLIFPYGHMAFQYDGLLNPVKHEIIQHRISQIPESARPVMVKDCPYVTVNHFKKEDQEIMLLTNYSGDDYDNPVLALPFHVDSAVEVSRLDGSLRPVSIQNTEEGTRLMIHMDHMTSRCIIFKL